MVVVGELLSLVRVFDTMDCSPQGSSVHGILQATILEWVAISFSGDLPDPRIEPKSPALEAESLLTELQGKSSCGDVSKMKGAQHSDKEASVSSF